MNIFAVSRHPRKCARALDDLRLNKMMLETAQILCTVINMEERAQVTPYRSTHANSPIIKWTHRDPHHWSWLWHLGNAYGDEIFHRFERRHSSHRVVKKLTKNWPWLEGEVDSRAIEFHNGARHRGLELDFTDLPVHEAYRTYLCTRWNLAKRNPRWTNRGQPSWRS